MDIQKWTVVLIGLMVGVLILACFIPSITAYTDETKTIENVGSYFTTPDDGEHTIVIDATTITFDGEPCIYPDLSLYGSATVLIGEDWFLRIEKVANDTINYIIAGPPQQYIGVGNSANGSLTITINGTDVSFDGPASDAIRTGLTWMIADKGDYVLSHDPYVIDGTTFVGAIRNKTAYDLFEIVTGTIDTPSEYVTTPVRMYSFTSTETGTFTSASYTVDLATVNGDLKKLNQITEDMTCTYPTDGEVTKAISIDYVIVPVSLTYDNPAYVGGVLSIIMQMLPLIIGVGLLMVGVAYFITRY